MRRDGYLEFQPVSDVDATAFACTIVCRGRSRFWSDEEARQKTALVQVKPVPEHELDWYLYERERPIRTDLR